MVCHPSGFAGSLIPTAPPWSGVTLVDAMVRHHLRIHLFPPPLQLHHCPHSHRLRPSLMSPASISAPQACSSALPLHSSGVTLGLLLLSSTWVSTSPGSTSVSRAPGSSIHRLCRGHSSYWVCFGSLHGPSTPLPHGLFCQSPRLSIRSHRTGGGSTVTEAVHCIFDIHAKSSPCQTPSHLCFSVSSPGDLFCASHLVCSVLLW